MSVLTVHPGPALAGSVRLPGDKSITHRALILGFLATGETTIAGGNDGDDCRATLGCIQALGASIDVRGEVITVGGRGGEVAEPQGVLDCRNSGTTLRLLAGVVAARPLFAVLAGDASLHRRPVDRVVAPLRQMGARLRARSGDRLPPLAIEGGALRSIRYSLAMPSAQVASCVLLAGLGARGATTVAIPGAARDHMERLLPSFGVEVAVERGPGGGSSVTVVGPAGLRGTRVSVPGDLSAAAIFLAAAAAVPGARVTARRVGLNPTRTGLLDALELMGAAVDRVVSGTEAGEPVGDVTVTGPSRLEPATIPPEWIPRMVDEVPAWAVAASAAAGVSRVSGAAELRTKESDRLHGLAVGLGLLGVSVEESPDGLAVTGGPIRGGGVPACGDHRLAMAFAAMGSRAAAPVTVTDAGAIANSYPGFVGALRLLGARIEGGTDAGGPS